MQLSSPSGSGSGVQGPDMSVQPGSQVKFGGWVYLESGSAGSGALGWWIEVEDANHNAITYIGTPNPGSSGSWIYQSATYTVPANAAFVHLYAQVYLPGSTTTLRIDDGFILAGALYYFADQLGSTRTITDVNGKLCYDADFTPYGREMQHTERLQTTACPPNYRFTGYDSETGLSYAFARYYSPRLGRFLSTDPLGGSVGSLQSHNAYAYTKNDPLNFVDPAGMNDCPDVIACGGDLGGGDLPWYFGPGNPGNGCSPSDASCEGTGGGIGIGIIIGLGGGQGGPRSLNIPTSVLGSVACGPSSGVWSEQIPICNAPVNPWLIIENVIRQDANGGLIGDLGDSICIVDLAGNCIRWLFWNPGTNKWENKQPTTTEDDRATALANAINKTGVQSLGNPCSVVAWYAASALGGVGVAGAMNAAEIGDLAMTYWPNAAAWLNRSRLLRGAGPGWIYFALRGLDAASHAIPKACNAMQNW
jgi:RHS repeat-associated protein